MFQKVQSFIEAGHLKKALKALRTINKLQELNERDLLRYFQLSRRIGDFQYGAVQLEKLGVLFPELEVEMAFFLGELGAVHQAIRLLKLNRNALSNEVEIQRHLQLGNFQSLTHDYPGAIASYSQMETLAKNNQPFLALVARLNVLGHRIYHASLYEEQTLLIRELKEFEESELTNYPLLRQGACYFLCLAHQKINQQKSAVLFLQQAYSLGVQHRMRESLLLDLTGLELAPATATKTGLSLLKKKILSQVHVVYMDQFHKIIGERCELEGKPQTAARYYQRVVFGGRPNGHFTQALKRWQALSQNYEPIPGWEVERTMASPLTSNQIIYNRLEKKKWPLFADQKSETSLADQSKLLCEMTLVLSRNLGFPVRDAEAWEHIWQVPFSFLSSPTVIRSLITRWRKSDLSKYAEISQVDRRLCLTIRQGAKFFCR